MNDCFTKINMQSFKNFGWKAVLFIKFRKDFSHLHTPHPAASFNPIVLDNWKPLMHSRVWSQYNTRFNIESLQFLCTAVSKFWITARLHIPWIVLRYLSSTEAVNEKMEAFFYQTSVISLHQWPETADKHGKDKIHSTYIF